MLRSSNIFSRDMLHDSDSVLLVSVDDDVNLDKLDVKYFDKVVGDVIVMGNRLDAVTSVGKVPYPLTTVETREELSELLIEKDIENLQVISIVGKKYLETVDPHIGMEPSDVYSALAFNATIQNHTVVIVGDHEADFTLKLDTYSDLAKASHLADYFGKIVKGKSSALLIQETNHCAFILKAVASLNKYKGAANPVGIATRDTIIVTSLYVRQGDICVESLGAALV